MTSLALRVSVYCAILGRVKYNQTRESAKNRRLRLRFGNVFC